MARVKEHAKRGAIIIAAAGFLVMTVGTVFLAGQQSGNPADSSADLQKQLQEQINQQQEAQELNEPLEGYQAEAFDAASVTELKADTLVQGDGEVATADSTVKANYFGWTSDGKIFDSSKKKGAEAEPVEFPLSGVIKGWTEGLTGIAEGSVVKLTIPGDKAYGNTDDGSGRPFGPLVFVVELKEVKAVE